MDGKFVEDIQLNEIKEINAINIVSKYKLDVHLMVEDPCFYIDKLDNMNIEYITFHLEVNKNIKKIISKIKEKNYKVGISIKPKTDIKKIIPYLKDIDLVLVMSVEPGKGGQKFLTNTINRVNKIKKIITKNNYNTLIEVDGGINDNTISNLENVDIAVVGSYIIKSDNYYQQIEKLLTKNN
jgi:ribulose-phosphate 3-epimerase